MVETLATLCDASAEMNQEHCFFRHEGEYGEASDMSNICAAICILSGSDQAIGS